MGEQGAGRRAGRVGAPARRPVGPVDRGLVTGETYLAKAGKESLVRLGGRRVKYMKCARG